MNIVEVSNPIHYLLDFVSKDRSAIYFDHILPPLDFRQNIENPSSILDFKTKDIDNNDIVLILRFRPKEKVTLIFDCTKNDVINSDKFLSVKEKYDVMKDEELKDVEVIFLSSNAHPKGITLDNSALTNFLPLPEHDKFSNIKKLLSKEALEFGVRKPKAMLMVGFPGTGKTQSAKYLAHVLNRDFYKLDVANIYNRLVGDSEKALQTALNFVSKKEVVLFIDEVDKLFSQKESASEVSGKLLSVLLTWLSEEHDCYVVMAANRVSGIPIELLRKGRVDSITHCRLPDDTTIKLLIDQFGQYLQDKSPQSYRGYAHSEIVWLCEKSRENAFLKCTKPIDMKPLSVVRPDQLYEITDWADQYES